MTSPLQEYNKANPKRWDVLVDIPKWEKQSLFTWLYGVLVKQTEDFVGDTHTSYNANIIREIETKNRILIDKDLGINARSWPDLRLSLETLLRNDSRRVVLFLELVIKYIRDGNSPSLSYAGEFYTTERILNRLETIMSNGSLWSVVTVKGSESGLIERVNQEITNIAKEMEDGDLNEAWSLAYRPAPEPEKAIEYAQAAIESTASKYGLTKATSKVYGTLLGDIKKMKSASYVNVAKPEFDLSNALAGKNSKELDPNDEFTDWFATGMNIIRRSNPAHHRSTKTSSFKASPNAAKQAVLIATLYCHIIKEGYIAKISK